MAITIVTNAAARNIEINGLSSSTWTINGEAKDCRFSGGGLVDISGDATTPVDGLYILGSTAGVLTVSGSEQAINNVAVTTTSTVTLVSVTGNDNHITGLQMTNTRAIGLSVGGSRNKIDFNQQSNTATTNTYDAVSVAGSDNRIEGLVNLEAANAYRYGVNVSGNGNWFCVTADDAATAYSTDTGTGNTFCLDSGSVENSIGQWQAWSPSYANLTVGNGTVAARYTQIGKTIICDFTFTLGSTSAVGTNPTVSLPVTASNTYTAVRNNVGQGYVLDSGTATFQTDVRLESTTVMASALRVTSGTYQTAANITATVPITWATGDILYMRATYEAA